MRSCPTFLSDFIHKVQGYGLRPFTFHASRSIRLAFSPFLQGREKGKKILLAP
jgi:hypothetical protein